jgi:uncharacterized protein (TIGR01777 family)
MKICITGSTGFLGSRIKGFFQDNGYDVESIRRSDFALGVEVLASKIEGADMLINLAGASILKRWTEDYKKEIYSSRINTAKKIVEAIKLVKSRPSIVISASAVGVYDSTENHDEFSDHLANDFLANVCKDWEAAITPLINENIRLAIIRSGIVLDAKEGALAKMLPSFKWGMGAVIGNGYQSMPFIHIQDFLAAIWYIYKNPASKGIYNLVAPEIVSNQYFCMKIGEKLKKPVWLRLNSKLLRWFIGEGASVFIKGQNVQPNRLIELDFPFQFPTLDSTLEDLLVNKRKR